MGDTVWPRKLDGGRQTIYRTVTRARSASKWGYGRTPKRTSRDSYRNRTMSELVVVYVLRGTGNFTDGRGVTHRIGAGDALIHWPDRPESLEIELDGAWYEMWITADRAFSTSMYSLGVLSPERTVLHIGFRERIVDLFDRFGRTLTAMNDEDVDRLALELHELFVEMNRLTRVSGAEESDIGLIQRACRLLAESFAARQSVPILAEKLGVSYERFRKIFRTHVGVAPGEYRVRRRIDRARELIAQQHLTNREVAEKLGYADPYVFSKQFKRMVGESPASFRKRVR